MYEPSAKTAIKRKSVSAPVWRLIEEQLFWGRVCNWGSGYADQDSFQIGLLPLVTDVIDYDPQFDDHLPFDEFDVIYCGYVLNVLPPKERYQCVEDVVNHLKKDGKSVAFFAVRSDKIKGEEYLDGVMTSKGTFQKSFKAAEFKQYLLGFGRADVMSFGHYLIGMIVP